MKVNSKIKKSEFFITNTLLEELLAKEEPRSGKFVKKVELLLRRFPTLRLSPPTGLSPSRV